MEKRYVQYGCGLSAPKEWENFDVSPTLRIQKFPIIGKLARKRLNVVFPKNVKYGDIIKGLPIDLDSCDGVFCSHTLEHLSFNDCKMALKNTIKILKPGGIFRCVVPDLESAAITYLQNIESKNRNAGNIFLNDTLLGVESRPKGLKNFLSSFFGNSHHLWMWDKYSLYEEIKNAGFKSIRICEFNDSEDDFFKLVEDVGRFNYAIALEAKK